VEDKAQIVGEEITRLNNYAVDKINSPFPIPHWIPTPLNRKERKSLDTLDKVIFEIINTRRKSKEQKDDLLSMLLDVKDEDTGERMSDKQLRDEVMTIFIAGNETSSNALTWTLYLLSQNPEIEKRFVQEIKERFADKPITTQSIMEFHYSRMILEESMRLYPPAWIVGRRPLEDVEIEGYQIPKDTNILMPVFYLHKNPLYWQEPDKFDPERFAPEIRNNIDRFVYLPFGGGPRMCIGNHFALLEMQIVITMLYSRFTFELQKDFVVELDPLVTLRPKNGLMMKVMKRDN
jgi:cytochrome P450